MDTWKILTKIHLSKTIQVTAYIYIYSSSAFQSKIGYALLMRTILELIILMIVGEDFSMKNLKLVHRDQSKNDKTTL